MDRGDLVGVSVENLLDEGDEYEARGQAMEIFTLTVPDENAPRGRQFKGRIFRTWKLPPEAAQLLEDSFTRHAAHVRTKVRLYRGDRELLGQGDRDDRAERDEHLPASAPAATAPATDASPAVASEREHLQMIHESIRLAQGQLAATQRQLGALEAEVVLARQRRDDELRSHQAMIAESSRSMLAMISGHRDHAAAEQVRSFNLDRQAGEQAGASWARVIADGQQLDLVRKLMREGVMADHLEKYLSMGGQLIKGVADSQIGQVLALTLASKASGVANEYLAQKGANGVDGEGRKVRPEDVLIGAALRGAAFQERVEMLSRFAPLAGPLVGQALLLGPAFCLGNALPDAIQDLCERSSVALAVTS